MLFIVNETSSGLEGCTFETGTCHWEDKSVGQSQWVRGRNATGNTGPPVDHTLGTDLGNEKKKRSTFDITQKCVHVYSSCGN